MKRLFDITFSIIALFIFALPILVISFLLLFREKHKLIFKQNRAGKDKKTFEIYKFQSMVDGEVTSTGRFLRKSGLDELPQFINVLKGDMSIVGPRALTQSDIERLNWQSDFHNIRWQQRPGITGFGQIYGGQHKKTSWFWDKYYISNQNIFIDFVIVSISFLMNILGKTKVRQIVFPKEKFKVSS